MGGTTVVQQLARFTVAVRDDLPPHVASSAQQRLLDVLGLQVAALNLPTSVSALAFVRHQGGHGQAVATGLGHRVPATWAAFANGVLAHSLDYDDTHLPSIVHPSASVVPAVLAAGEEVGALGRTATAAVAAGVEVTVRLGMAGYDRASSNSVYFEHGQHATSVCGAVGSAAGAASVMGLSAEQVAHAMGIAVSMAGGVIEANRTGGTVKRLHCGWAAHAGVSSAQLAAYGFTGPPTVLEGRFGFFEAFLHGKVDLDAVTAGLGTSWNLLDVFYKPYPANHFTHAGIDAALKLRERGLRAQEVAHAELAVATPTVRTIGTPLEIKQRPETGYQAQFSGPYTVAAALLGGSGLGLGISDFTDQLARDPTRRDLMARVSVVGSQECDDIYPYQFPAILSVRTHGGDDLVERVLVNRGGTGNPLSDDELLQKFLANAGVARGHQASAEVARVVTDLNLIDDPWPAIAAFATGEDTS